MRCSLSHSAQVRITPPELRGSTTLNTPLWSVPRERPPRSHSAPFSSAAEGWVLRDPHGHQRCLAPIPETPRGWESKAAGGNSYYSEKSGKACCSFPNPGNVSVQLQYSILLSQSAGRQQHLPPVRVKQKRARADSFSQAAVVGRPLPAAGGAPPERVPEGQTP